jgi:hypothetical protein
MQIGLVIILSRRVVQHGDMQIGLVIILSRRVVQHGDMQIGLVTYNFVAPCCVTWRDMKIGVKWVLHYLSLCVALYPRRPVTTDRIASNFVSDIKQQ